MILLTISTSIHSYTALGKQAADSSMKALIHRPLSVTLLPIFLGLQ